MKLNEYPNNVSEQESTNQLIFSTKIDEQVKTGEFDLQFLQKLPVKFHQEYAEKMINNHQEGLLGLNLEHFQSLNEIKIIDKFFDAGKGSTISYMADKIKPENLEYLVDKCIETKKFVFIFKYLLKFQELPWAKIYKKIMKDDYGLINTLIELNAEQLTVLDYEDIERINNFIASEITDYNKYDSFYSHIKKLPWLNDKIADKIINVVKLNPIKVFPGKFKNLKVDTVKEITKFKKPHQLIEDVNQFDEQSKKYLEKNYSLFSCQKDLGKLTEKILTDYHHIKISDNPIMLARFIDKIKSLQEKLTSGERQTADIINSEYYHDIVEMCYGGHSSYTTYNSNESCFDRTNDLDQFNIKPVYKITLLPSSEMVVKEGESLDQDKLDHINSLISHARTILYAEQKVDVKKYLISELAKLRTESNQTNIHPAPANFESDLLDFIIADYVSGKTYVPAIKQLLIDYQLLNYPGIREYMEGTTDQAQNSKSPAYYYLINLREFFVDRLKDTKKEIATKALTDERLFEKLPDYYNLLNGKTTRPKNIINNDDELYIKLDKILATKKKTNFSLFNKDGEGNDINGSIGPKAKALAGLIRSELKRKEIESAENNVNTIEYNQELFAGYLEKILVEIFKSEIEFIDQELAKFEAKESTGQKKAYTLDAYFTKNHTSAHARAVAGVCVSGDNPISVDGKPQKDCLWDLPNYLQLVLIDHESKTCQGLILLHYYEENGQKILTASFNPSSTYLYKVNEKELFNQLMEQLIVFANDNNIDQIMVSKHDHIRTNRTGGEFEKAMKDQIKKIDKTFEFNEPKQFSFKPKYKQQAMYVIWERSNELGVI